ncbi:MAG: TlpA family protein disulfide reductase [Spirochaetales bacterium]|nr:TlpA family protein disulfide reductase [Spirochaetales bacterium]
MKQLGLLTLCIAGFISCSQQPIIPSDAELMGLGITPLPSSQPFPNLEFTDEDGLTRQLEEFQGNIVLLNFWATWCPPCRAEIPDLVHLNSRLERQDFALIALNVEEDPSLVKEFSEEFQVTFPVYYDLDGSASRLVGIPGLPTTLVIDRDGVARGVVSGALDWGSPEMVAMLKAWSR